ncbi:MAG: hypothetical protein QXS54_03100 [Candidatus Methanomethylicaceae archaeon]
MLEPNELDILKLWFYTLKQTARDFKSGIISRDQYVSALLFSPINTFLAAIGATIDTPEAAQKFIDKYTNRLASMVTDPSKSRRREIGFIRKTTCDVRQQSALVIEKAYRLVAEYGRVRAKTRVEHAPLLILSHFGYIERHGSHYRVKQPRNGCIENGHICIACDMLVHGRNVNFTYYSQDMARIAIGLGIIDVISRSPIALKPLPYERQLEIVDSIIRRHVPSASMVN